MKKINTIKKYREFKEIIELRKFYRNELFCIYFRKNECKKTRIGILVSKKNGNAVIRNKIKRQVRSIIDSFIDYQDDLDLIIVITKKYSTDEFDRNKELLTKLISLTLGDKK